MGSVLGSFGISSQGLTIQRAKMNAVAENLANAETTETREGGPYRRKRVLVEEQPFRETFQSALQRPGTKLHRTNSAHRGGAARGVMSSVEYSKAQMQEVQDPASSFKLVYDPSHPQADQDGYVKMPDVEVINEMVDMIEASRAYEANTVAISSAKKMAKDALDI